MKKPQALREYLLKSLPNLSPDEDRLLIMANNGTLRSTMASGFSFEMAYTLDIIITDYAGDVDAIGVVLFSWIAANQPELMANLDKSKQAVSFEAEMIDNHKCDIQFQIPLTERVIVKKLENGQFDISYPGEPTYTELEPAQVISVRDTNDIELTTIETANKTGWSLDMPPTGRNP
ncbi:phage tail protein [Acinetobacter thermotolerans]|uniref:phage tail protein n=1 Tax=Acinetobacter thermotolerans TaxID=3151487 RepID=UPI00325A99E4